MTRRPSFRLILLAGVPAVVLSAAFAVAQWSVDTRVDKRTNVADADRRVDKRIDNQIYGSNSGSVRYGQPYSSRPYSSQPQMKPAASSNALPSEVRYARYTSGALPSEIRGNYAAMGPMPGYGAMPYIPPPRQSFDRSTVSQAPIDYRVDTQTASGGSKRNKQPPSPLRVDASVKSPSLPGAVPVGNGVIHNNPMVATLPTNTDYAFAPLGSSGSTKSAQRPSVSVPLPPSTQPSWDDTLNRNAPSSGSIRYGGSR